MALSVSTAKIEFKTVKRTSENRRIFRTLARDNCGESMEPGETERIYFGYGQPDKQGNDQYKV